MCPPGVDQTGRLPQTWRIIAPELNQIHYLGQYEFSSTGIFSVLFKKCPAIDLFALLARPVVHNIPIQKSSVKRSKSNDNGKSSFQRLSTELLYMIMDNLGAEKKDLICLALSSKDLYEILVHRVQSQYRQNLAPWANTPLLHQGNYSLTVPDSLIKEGYLERYAPGNSWDRMPAARRFFWAFSGSESPKTINQECADWLSVAEENLKESGLSDKICQSLKKKLECDFFPKDRTWLLRNLSKHEYISSDSPSLKIDGQEKEQKGTFKQFTFEDLFLMRTCWTSMPTVPEWGCGEEVWAGDRFDLVTAEAHAEEKGDTVWRDVSDEVVKEAEKIETYGREEEQILM